jgi:hypothetical protein
LEGVTRSRPAVCEPGCEERQTARREMWRSWAWGRGIAAAAPVRAAASATASVYVLHRPFKTGQADVTCTATDRHSMQECDQPAYVTKV